MEMLPTSLILAAFGLAALGATLMAALRMWQGWLDLKQAELTRRTPERGGEERGDIAELRARVKQLEAIAACVDL